MIDHAKLAALTERVCKGMETCSAAVEQFAAAVREATLAQENFTQNFTQAWRAASDSPSK